MSLSYFGQYNERFTLVDVEGIHLTSPLDELNINYPENFAVPSFTTERHNDYRAFIKEFQNAEESSIIFDKIAHADETESPWIFIKAILELGGIDAKINLRSYRTPTGGAEEYREYKLNLDSAKKQDTGYDIRVRRVKFNDKLRTRKAVGVNVESSENIDGIADTALTLIEKPLHSRAVLREFEGDYVTTEEVEDITYDASYMLVKGVTGSSGFMDLGFRNIIKDEFESANNERDAWHPEADLLPWFKIPDDGFYYYRIRITTEDNLADANYNNPDKVVLRFVRDGVATDNDLSISTLPSGGVDYVTYSIFQTFEQQKGDTVFLYFYDALNKPFFHTPVFEYLGDVYRDDYATIEGLTYTAPSMASGHFIYDLLNKTIQKLIGDETYDPLSSSLLEKTEDGAASDGDASLNFMTTGNKIRQLPNSLIVDFQNIVDFVVKRYNAGMALITVAGNQTVLIERASHFFQNVEIMRITAYEEFSEEHDTNNIFNEVELGYNKYSDPKEHGTIQGFNTKRGYVLPVESVEKKKIITTNVITDDMEIERLRRTEKKQLQSDQADEDLFAIKCFRFNATNRIAQSSTDTDFDHGDPQRQKVEYDGANTITLHGYYLKGQIDTASTITVGVQSNCALALTEVAHTITNIIYDLSANQTIITVSGTLAATAVYTCYAFHFDIEVILPERLEAFTAVDGLTDKYSVYNLAHVPTEILFEWFPMLAFGINEKAGTKKVKFTNRRNNVDVEKKGGNYSGTDLITETDDFELSVLRGYNDTYLNRKYYKLVTRMNYDADLLPLIDSLNGDHASTNWGYVTIATDLDGQEVQFFPDVAIWNLEKTEVTLQGWGKRASVYPEAPTSVAVVNEGTLKQRVSWDTMPLTDTYNVYSSTVTGFTPSPSNRIATGITALDFLTLTLAAGTTYYYRVAGVNLAGEGAMSAEVSETTAAAIVTAMIITVKTDNAGTSNNDQFKFPFPVGSTSNVDVDIVGGASVATGVTQASPTITFAGGAGTYQIEVTGLIDGWTFLSSGDELKITDVSNWGIFSDQTGAFLNPYRSAFDGCAELQVSATDVLKINAAATRMFYGCTKLIGNSSFNTWVTTGLTLTGQMFQDCPVFNAPVGSWDMTQVTSINAMFKACTLFNQPLDGWDVGAVTTMKSAFELAGNFNQDLNSWDVSNVTTMDKMFYMFGFTGVAAFNGNIASWNTTSLVDCDNMFLMCKAFNQDIGEWDMSNVTQMISMLSFCTSFNQDLSKWDVSGVLSLANVFKNCFVFNNGANTDTNSGTGRTGINGWDVSSATSMEGMFENNQLFNRDLDDWDVGSVTNFDNLFSGSSIFNGNVSSWDTSSGTRMQRVFSNAKAFNQDLSGWDVSGATTLIGFFSGCLVFNNGANTATNAGTGRAGINGWDVSNVTSMITVFQGTQLFNRDLDDWDVGAVTTMESLFQSSGMNGDLTSWDTSNVTNLKQMFWSASAFNQDISGWNVDKVTTFYRMFASSGIDRDLFSGWKDDFLTTRAGGVPDCLFMFDGSAMSQANYDAMLISLDSVAVINGVTIGVEDLLYTAAGAGGTARGVLDTTEGWTFNLDVAN